MLLESQPVIVKTSRAQWVIPYNHRMLRMLIEDEELRVEELEFSTSQDQQQFLKRLFILAVMDENEGYVPSPLAEFGRSLLNRYCAEPQHRLEQLNLEQQTRNKLHQ